MNPLDHARHTNGTDELHPAPQRQTGPPGGVVHLERIPGGYQHRALTSGPRIQRYWHLAKQRLIGERFLLGEGDDALDIGCGSGVIADLMASRARTVVGVDGNRDAIDYARATFARDNLRFEHSLLEDLDLEARSFSAAVCMEVFEHLDVDAVSHLLARTADALVDGGRLLVTTPNYRGVWPILEWLADRSGKVARLEGDQHITQFTAATLRSVLTRAGFEVLDLGTFCTVAPFASPLGTTVADRILKFELSANLRFGALLYAVARRP